MQMETMIAISLKASNIPLLNFFKLMNLRKSKGNILLNGGSGEVGAFPLNQEQEKFYSCHTCSTL